MRAYQVFAGMSPEEASRVLDALQDRAPGVYTQAVGAASAAFKARPRFLLRQPREKRAQMVRRALSRVAASDLAEEVLAHYFLEVKRPLLVEWLDAVGVPHEEGVLQDAEAPPPPEETKLREAVTGFLRGEEPEDRALLLRAFAAQGAVDWPALDPLLPPPSGG